ncbi:MAG: hypothetical protein D4R43_03135 [Sphingobacteriales bacterium]|nr:MAG: hypothetical protein D4R43_03135 [Sphingobacteriales bacterium]
MPRWTILKGTQEVILTNQEMKVSRTRRLLKYFRSGNQTHRKIFLGTQEANLGGHEVKVSSIGNR